MTIEIAAPTKPAVLVVDDDERTLLAMQEILQSERFELVIARSGEEALRRLLDHNNFALIVLDITMPGLDGFETVRLIKSREQSRHVPVCFLSFAAQDQRALRAYSLGAVDYLTKPVDPEILTAKVHVFVELHEANRKLSALNHALNEQRLNLAEANETLQAKEKRLRAALNEKEILLKEVHHRVKNNLQMISSLLSLQSSYFKDDKVLEIFQECRSRIQAMALIHNKLYQSKDVARVDLPGYLKSLAESLIQTYDVDIRAITLRAEMQDLLLSIDVAIPLGLVMNELLSNALKHAFPERRKGSIALGLVAEARRCVLTISDDGVGLPDHVDTENPQSMGLHIVKALVHQLEARLDVARTDGTVFTLTVPH